MGLVLIDWYATSAAWWVPVERDARRLLGPTLQHRLGPSRLWHHLDTQTLTAVPWSGLPNRLRSLTYGWPAPSGDVVHAVAPDGGCWRGGLRMRVAWGLGSGRGALLTSAYRPLNKRAVLAGLVLLGLALTAGVSDSAAADAASDTAAGVAVGVTGVQIVTARST